MVGSVPPYVKVEAGGKGRGAAVSGGVSGGGASTFKFVCSVGSLATEKTSGPLQEGKALLATWWLGTKAYTQTKQGQVTLDGFYDLKYRCYSVSLLLYSQWVEQAQASPVKRGEWKSHPSVGGDSDSTKMNRWHGIKIKVWPQGL